MTKISRRKFSELGLLSAAAMPFFSYKNLVIKNKISSDFPKVRVDISKRNYKDEVVEATILRIKENCKDKEIAWLFENCFPNTLDTTVSYEEKDGIPDTFVITGDIDAMWLRDSTAQVWPYLDLAVKSDGIKKLILGVINRQSKCIQIDPYANAFNHHPHRGDWFSDHTTMKEELHERKWEIDSLCYPVRLAFHFWKKTGDKTAFSDSWFKTAQTIFKTFKEQQRFDGPGPYRFGRTTSWSTDTVPGNGYGNNTRPNGLIHSTFRPSDDATLYPFLIPANYFALVSLKQMAEISKTIYHNDAFAADCTKMAGQIKAALDKFAQYSHPVFGRIIPMEVDGFGNHLLQDDANVPNLLAMPYLGTIDRNDPLYVRTRKFVLSDSNPYFFIGKAAEGIGSPHTLVNQIWPIAIIIRAMTSTSDAEIIQQLKFLKKTHAGTGFMHESFDKDDASKFSRKWFAWANTLFGELILKIEKERPHLLKMEF